MSVRKWDPFSNWILRESEKAINYGVITISTTTLRTNCLEFMQKSSYLSLLKKLTFFLENWNFEFLKTCLQTEGRSDFCSRPCFFFTVNLSVILLPPFFENPFRFYWELKHCLSLVTGTKEGSMLYTVFGQTISLKALSETQLGVNNMAEVNFNVFSWSILTYFLE